MDHQAWTSQQPVQQPSSTMSGSTPSINDGDDGDDPEIVKAIRDLAFPQSHSSCTPQEIFVGRVCLKLHGRPLVEKRQLLTCSDTDENLDVASFTLGAFVPPGQQGRSPMHEFQQWLRGTLELLRGMPEVRQVRPLNVQLSEDRAIGLRDQVLATLSLASNRGAYIFLHVFGNVPELWVLLAYTKPPGGSDRKGKGRDGNAHPTSAPAHAPASTLSNLDAADTTAPLPQGVPTGYQPRPATGTSQYRPALSSDQGGRSVPYPPPPEGSQQSQFSRHQPEPLVVAEAPVQGTSGSISRRSSQLSPFDLSKLSDELQTAEQDFHLPELEMSDLGQATAALHRHLRAGSSTNVATSSSNDNAPSDLPELPPEYMHFKTGRGVRICDTARRIAQWLRWMLDFQDTCERLGLEVPQDFQPELDKVARVKTFLTILVLHTTGQFRYD